MGKLKGRRPWPALLVAVVALVAALSGGAVAGVAVTSLSKKDKKQVKKISKKQAKKLDKKIELKAGPKGDPGEDATNLFAYVEDAGSSIDAIIGYGQGATGVSDPAGDNTREAPYVVTFERDLSRCVAQANAGAGDPVDNPALGANVLRAAMNTSIEGSTVEVYATGVGASSDMQSKDTSFMLSVFC